MTNVTAIALAITSFAVLQGCASVRPELSAGVDFASRYVCRGAVFQDAPVLQPCVTASQTVGEGKLSASGWANVSATDEFDDLGQANEVDLTVEYARSFGQLSTSLGYAYYLFPVSGANDTSEIYSTLSIDELLLTPTLTAYWDVGEADGVYAAFDLSREILLCESLTLACDAGAGWMSPGMADYYFGVREEGLSDLTVSATLSWAAFEHGSFGLGVSWAHVIDDAYRDAVALEDPVWLTLGFQTCF